MKSRIVAAALFTFLSCTQAQTSPKRTTPDSGFGHPPWHQWVVDSDGISAAYGYRYPPHDMFLGEFKKDAPFIALGERKKVSPADEDEIRDMLSARFTTAELKCVTHIDGALFLSDGHELDLCFGCGTVVADEQRWNHADGDRFKAIFLRTFGSPRPAEPDLHLDPY